MSRQYFLAACLAGLAVVVSASLNDSLRAPLLQFGGLWVRATQELGAGLRGVVLSIPEWTTPWTVAGMALGAVLAYYAYHVLWAPMDRTLLLGEAGYIADGKMSRKDAVNLARRQRAVGDCPPVYPNGWFSVLETRDLSPGQVQNVNVLGE